MKKITPLQLKELLKEGIVEFQFKKVDGTLRPSRGTTCNNNIPVSAQAKGGTTPGEKIAFYDLEKLGWRSVSMDSEIFV